MTPGEIPQPELASSKVTSADTKIDELLRKIHRLEEVWSEDYILLSFMASFPRGEEREDKGETVATERKMNKEGQIVRKEGSEPCQVQDGYI